MARTLLTSAAAFAVCALAASGCGRHSDEPTPAKAPDTASSTAVSAAADAAQDAPQNPPKDDTKHVRQAVREFIAERYPNAEVEGVWMLQARGNYCFAGADTVLSSRHRNIDVLVRQYLREDGSHYWRGEGFGPDTAAMLQNNASPLTPSDSSDDAN